MTRSQPDRRRPFFFPSSSGRRVGGEGRGRRGEGDQYAIFLPSPPGREGWKILLACAFWIGVAGCSRDQPAPLVVATTWSAADRSRVEGAYRRESGDPGPIAWVVVGAGERLRDFLDRRGGVDVVLGGTEASVAGLAEAGRLTRVEPSDPVAWRVASRVEKTDEGSSLEPRDIASTPDGAGASPGPDAYASLVRKAARSRPARAGGGDPASESLALSASGREPTRARRFLTTLENLRLVKPAPAGSADRALADSLRADLLDSALIDAHKEIREAAAALDRFGHPPAAESAFGARPPWPPASVAKLRAIPGGPALLDTFAEQVAPDPGSRAWLVASWSGPNRPVDGPLLAEIAAADGGKLAREPRFRAWLRAEWATWNRQLYRRVARVAGGYVPS